MPNGLKRDRNHIQVMPLIDNLSSSEDEKVAVCLPGYCFCCQTDLSLFLSPPLIQSYFYAVITTPRLVSERICLYLWATLTSSPASLSLPTPSLAISFSPSRSLSEHLTPRRLCVCHPAASESSAVSLCGWKRRSACLSWVPWWGLDIVIFYQQSFLLPASDRLSGAAVRRNVFLCCVFCEVTCILCALWFL